MLTGLVPRRARLSAVLPLVVCTPAAWCQQADQLQQVIVTASRVPEPEDQSLFSVTVLTRADIEARQVLSVQDLLADLAGINIDNTGGLGQQSSVFIRGADSDHTLLLIDGVRVGSATLGTAPFEIIPLEQIDHIEVVRGPRSTLYGSDAVGGVIQIFTRQADDPGATFGGSAMTGSYDTHQFTGYLAGRGSQAWGSISGDVLTTGGIPACLPSAIAGCFDPAAPQVPDGHQNRSGSLDAGVRLTDTLTASADVLYTHGWTAFDGDGFDDRLDFQEKVFSARLEQALGSTWHLRLMAGRDEDDERDFLDPTPVGTFDTVRDSASLQADGKLTEALKLISGVDYEDVHVDSDTPYAVTSRTTRALFSELHADLGEWSALAGARFEDNEQFGDHWTENLGLARKLGDGVRLVLTWGTAFRAPTFDELYFPGFGNPDLKPETSQSWETGLDGEQAAFRWSLHAYQTTIDDEISIDPLTFLPVNIDKARIRGVELQGDWHSADWVVGGQLTGLEPLNISPGPEYDDLLPRRAQQNASLTLRRLVHTGASASADGSFAVVARWEGRRYDDLANTLPMGGYLTVDLLTQWRLDRDWTLEAKAANLFDRSYQTAAYYAEPGRSYGVTIRYRSSLH
ncbi:MAG TPA: TonB-dependent receptor [Steroidobacteraceae bacterium]|nr:TonB-dependent receptor [Steroidobacteraceae bacterium]